MSRSLSKSPMQYILKQKKKVLTKQKYSSATRTEKLTITRSHQTRIYNVRKSLSGRWQLLSPSTLAVGGTNNKIIFVSSILFLGDFPLSICLPCRWLLRDLFNLSVSSLKDVKMTWVFWSSIAYSVAFNWSTKGHLWDFLWIASMTTELFRRSRGFYWAAIR